MFRYLFSLFLSFALSIQFSFGLENKLPGLTGGGLVGFYMPSDKGFEDCYGGGGLISGLEASLRISSSNNIGLYAVGHYSFFRKLGKSDYYDLKWEQSFLSFGGRFCYQINSMLYGFGLGLTQMRISEIGSDLRTDNSGLGFYLESGLIWRIQKFLGVGLNAKIDFRKMDTDFGQLDVGGVAVFLGVYVSVF